MKKTVFCLSVPALLFCAAVVSAQTSVDANVGAGYAWNKSNNAGIDNAASAGNAFGSCTPGSSDTFCQTTGSLNSVFMGFGGDVMFKKQFGFGAQVDFQPSKKDYGPLQFRQMFYDFDGVYAPITTKRAIVHLQAGIGGARTSFSYTQSGCVGTAVCSSSSSSIGAATHLDTHFGVGVMLFVTDHIYVKPQFDLHYVPSFTNQFNSNLAPMAMFSIGYHSGDK